MTNYNMIRITSYGSNVYKTPILENAPIEDIRDKYLKMTGNYLGSIFDRNYSENKSRFTVPYSYDTIHIIAI